MKTQITVLALITNLAFQPCKAQLQLDSTFLSIETIAENLEVPWEIAWGPDDKIWFTERPGNVKRVDPETKVVEPLLTIPIVESVSESGLLGMAFHPNFNHPDSQFVYLVYTYLNNFEMTERLVRYTYDDNSLIDPLILLDDIPANNNHNGSRILILPDRTILMTTGDAQSTSLAQNTSSLAGKVLRINLDGSIPADNPSPTSYNWSIGHRNPQGLVRAGNGIIYSSEHGPSNDDEVNIIQKDGNYGWPTVQGYCNTTTEINFCNNNDVTEPIIAWTPTLAVAGLDYYNSEVIPEWQNALLLTTLKEDDFRVLRLNESGDIILTEDIYFDNAYGRLRDICVSPAGDIYISTSNRDGRGNNGFPIANDDRIIKIFNDNKEITGLQELSDSFIIYPNPTTNLISVNSTEKYSMRIYDFSSRLLLSIDQSNSINISTLKNGSYLIKLTSEDKKSTFIKIVKK